MISVAKTIVTGPDVACSGQQKNGKMSRRAHLTVLVHRDLAIMLGRDIKLYTTVEPPAFDPSVAPPKIFAKYALSQKSADTPWICPCVPPKRNHRDDLIV